MIGKLLLLFLLLVLAAILALQELERRWQQPLTLPEEGVVLLIAPGESLRAVVDDLHDQGILCCPDLLVLYARHKEIDQKIKHGEYLLKPLLTPPGLLELLQSGRVIQYQLTLPEGITLQQAQKIIADHPVLEPILEDMNDPRVVDLIAPYTHAEGLFFPDTYHFPRGTSDLQLLQRAHAKMVAVLADEWQGRAPGLPYKTAYEALIMASIIERETGLPAEREQIAGVFVRRLQRGMRLQTDPTVIYGMGSDFDGNLRRVHLDDDSNTYNTYRHLGLPPTPIALPGRESIHAALHPADGEDLYFVARGDGGHVFSATLTAHESAVRKYQLQRKQDYRSSPEKQ